MNSYGFEHIMALQPEFEKEKEPSEISFESGYSYDESPKDEPLPGVSPGENEVVAYFRKKAIDTHKTPWPENFYTAPKSDSTGFACFRNPPQAYECLNYFVFLDGQLHRSDRVCGFSRVKYPSIHHLELREETWENKKALQKMNVGIPSATLPEDVNTNFYCPLCLSHEPDLETHPDWKAHVDSDPNYRTAVQNPLAHLFNQRQDIFTGPWHVYINSLIDPEPGMDEIKDDKLVPGIRCRNMRFGHGSQWPDARCSYVWGAIVTFAWSESCGLAGRIEPLKMGPIAEEPDPDLPRLPDHPPVGALTELCPEWPTVLEEREETAEFWQEFFGFGKDGYYHHNRNNMSYPY